MRWLEGLAILNGGGGGSAKIVHSLKGSRGGGGARKVFPSWGQGVGGGPIRIRTRDFPIF